MYKIPTLEAYGFALSQTEDGFYSIALKDSHRETIDAWVDWVDSLSEPQTHVYALYDLRHFRVTPYAIKRVGHVSKRAHDLNLSGVFALLLEKSPLGQTLAHLINLRYFRTNQALVYQPFTDEAKAWRWLEFERQK